MPISLLTDFGTSDYFVGAMKGAILSIAPTAAIVDLSHQVPAQDIRSGAFTLLAAYGTFPPGTVHVAVVDPGVGSTRRPVAVAAGGHLFVGPDNGIFGYVYQRESDVRVFHVTNPRFFRSPVSATFHGRDVFAPVGAALYTGVAPETLGELIADYVRLDPLRPRRAPTGALLATIIHIDHFGNCVTSISRDDLPEATPESGVRLEVEGHEIRSLHHHFAQGAPGEVFALWGSAGFLELAARNDSAARLLKARRGAEVVARLQG